MPAWLGRARLASLHVSSPGDAAEIEADRVGRNVAGMEAPRVGSGSSGGVAYRQATGAAPPVVTAPSGLPGGMPMGSPLPLAARRFMEQRFGVDFSNVRIHTDGAAARLAAGLAARAVTIGNNIFFGAGRFDPEGREGRELLAHELTHTVQQSPAARRSPDPSISENAPPSAQRLGVGDALNWFADAANNVPGFAMLTFVIGVNPINMRPVERNATNLFRAVMGLITGGEMIFQALQRHGIIDRVGAWLQQQLGALGASGRTLRQALDRFLDSLGLSDLFNLSGVWERAKRIFLEPIELFTRTVRNAVVDILRFIREAILLPVGRLAQGTRGYDLLRAVFGEDPVTGEVVPRTAENLIGGFMRLIGQEEKWNYLREGNAVPRMWAWFQQQFPILLGFVRQIPVMFSRLWQSLQIPDLLDIGAAFGKIRDVFGGFISSFISWAGEAAYQILVFLFEVLAPRAMPVLRRASSVLRTIINNPIRFIGHLVRAGARGFQQFADNIRTHLINGLVGWLTGALTGAGLQLPARWDLRGILSLVLQVLGLTWQNIRQKLLRHLPESVLTALETTFDIVVTLVREGPAAAWQKILEQLDNLQEMVFGQIREWVIRTVVTQAIIRVVSFLNPAGAIIQAIMAIYNTVVFLQERLQQIIQVAESVLGSIAEIAAGNITAAAGFVERTMARIVPVVISFLARLLGLGGISDTIRNIVARIRAPIDRALDRVVTWIVAQARRLGRAVIQAGVPQDPRQRLQQGLSAAAAVVNRLPGNRLGEALIRPVLAPVRARYGFRVLDPQLRSGRWWLTGNINPVDSIQTSKASEDASGAAVAGANTALPNQVDILSSSGEVMIRNYSRSGRTGILQGGMFSGSVTLSKIKHAPQPGQTGDQIVNATGSASIEYTISAANGLYPPPTNFLAVDREDPGEAREYTGAREAFPSVMRTWWETETNLSGDGLDRLSVAGLVIIGTNGPIGGAQKWQFIFRLLEAHEKPGFSGPVNRDNVSALVSQLPASRRDDLQTRWKTAWSGSTQIHHIKPLNFGGTNSNSNLIPLCAEKHIGSSGVHPRFWVPLKRFLMGQR